MTGSEVLTCGITLDFLFSTEIFVSSTIYCAEATRNLPKKKLQAEEHYASPTLQWRIWRQKPTQSRMFFLNMYYISAKKYTFKKTFYVVSVSALYSSFYLWSRLDQYIADVYQQDHRSGCLLKHFTTMNNDKQKYTVTDTHRIADKLRSHSFSRLNNTCFV